MDMAFLTRARRLLDGREPARLDHALLQATLAGGRARPRPADAEGKEQGGEEPLIELVTGGPDWQRAAARQRGCFNRAEAGRGGNGA
jgi:hypothetical protein